MSHRPALAALLLWPLAAFADATPPAAKTGAAPTVIVELHRSGCYGTCPVYDLVIYSDGRVDYQGRQFVKERGARTAKLAPADLAALHAAFAKAKYFELADKYTNYEVTDNPSALTMYRNDGRTKSIDHYYGDRSAPAALSDLESRIDAIVRVERWIGTRKERDAARGERGRNW
jgi:uncharacterized protein DUF6438